VLCVLQVEAGSYASGPKTFLQQWLRRDPDVNQLPLLLRAAHASAGGVKLAKEHVMSLVLVTRC
jgi:hypothetical protein